MPRNPARAVVRADQPAEGQGAALALQAVTREIDNRLAIIDASSVLGIRADRLKLVALTAFTRTPALWTCEPVSVARAIVEAGQLGLEPTGLLGGAYLVPRGGKATLLVGYRGLVMLAMRSQLVQRVEARVVREKDVFEYSYGLDPRLVHVPSQAADPGNYTGAYAVIFYRDGSRQFDYMSIAEIEATRGRSSAAQAGPWVTDYAEMCKKTPLRRLMKMAPLTVEVAAKLDELDPEGDKPTADGVAPSRQAELRAQLQAQLEGEFGGAPQLGAGPTTQATTSAGTTEGGQGDQPAEAAPVAAGTGGEPQQAPAADATVIAPAAAPAAKSEPERVGEVLGTTCGIEHEGLGTGPCVLAAGHTPAEHENAGGLRWTMPRGAGR